MEEETLEIPDSFYNYFKDLCKSLQHIDNVRDDNIKQLLTNDTIKALYYTTFRNTLISLSHNLTGDCLPHFPKLPSYPTPQYELSNVISLMNHLNNTRSFSSYNSVVYLNLCDSSKFYVGFSSDSYVPENFTKNSYNTMLSRIHSHRIHSPFDTYWNTLFPVITNLAFFPGNYDDEEYITLLVFHAVGPNNVAGSKWSRPGSSFPSFDVQHIINKLHNPTYTL